MSLGTRLTMKTMLIIAAVITLAAVAWWGVTGLNRDLDAALDEYDQLRDVYLLAVSIEQVRAGMRTSPDRPTGLRPKIMRLLLELEREDIALRPELIDQLREDLQVVHATLGDSIPGESGSAAGIAGALNTAINTLSAEADRIETRIAQVGVQANQRRETVTQWVVGSAVSCIAMVILISYWQYLAVMRPLLRLERGVKRLAQGDFAQPLSASGDREFVRLADDFNRMAEQLQGLYQSLEEKVRVRSAQLAQSERLASVGFLAAGVAHEINNPLAIMAGEAELALQGLSSDADADARASLATIRDEAFRCKGITQKLLSLARPGSGTRERVDVLELANEIAGLTRSLAQHEGRHLKVTGDRAIADTDPAQLKQVLLNITINALEATPTEGEVNIAVSSHADACRISVIDHGQGMDQVALTKVFEPFYTEKKTPNSPGLGLGLSISHAIVEDLGGTLSAKSPGPGQGSTFTIELPTAQTGRD